MNPTVTAAAIVLRLQGLVAQEVPPSEQAVLAIGSLHTGTAGNVLPGSATIAATLRAFSESILDQLVSAVRRVVRAECAASGDVGEPHVTVTSRAPVTTPAAHAVEPVRRAHEYLFGAARVSASTQSLASEDVALLGQAGATLHGSPDITLAYWLFGVAGHTPGAGVPVNHSPRFAPTLPARVHPVRKGGAMTRALVRVALPSTASTSDTGGFADTYLVCGIVALAAAALVPTGRPMV